MKSIFLDFGKLYFFEIKLNIKYYNIQKSFISSSKGFIISLTSDARLILIRTSKP